MTLLHKSYHNRPVSEIIQRNSRSWPPEDVATAAPHIASSIKIVHHTFTSCCHACFRELSFACDVVVICLIAYGAEPFIRTGSIKATFKMSSEQPKKKRLEH